VPQPEVTTGTAAGGAIPHHAVMRKLGTIALGVVIALGLALPAHAAPRRERYVANDAHFVLLAFLSGWSGIAMEGNISFVPTSDHAMIKIDDAVATGNVPVIVSTVDGVRHECLAAGRITALRGLVAHQRTWLYVMDTTYKGRCHAGATTGVISLL
jgi:hypothetical protein